MSDMINRGPVKFGVTRDSEGHRAYKISYLVQGTTQDGPASALSCPGLPGYGAVWVIGNDVDLYAYRRWDATVTQHKVENEIGRFFIVEMEFSTKPNSIKSCKEVQFENPLTEPMKISGSYVTYSEEATTNRFGQPVHNSAHEQMRGPAIEFDQTRAKVNIEQNVASLELELCGSMLNTLNDTTLWGMDPRCIKLSGFSWEKKFYGLCYSYYTRKFEFEARADGFDRDVLDEGTKVLCGHWDLLTAGTGSQGWILDNIDGVPPDPANPAHFIRFKDRRGENAKVILDGAGQPANDPSGLQAYAYVVETGDLPTREISSVAVSRGGSGYITAPAAVIIGGGGTGAKLTTTIAGGRVVAVNVIDGGTGYEFNLGNVPPVGPMVWIASPGGPGRIFIEKYTQSNFLLLGIPLNL